MSGTQPICTETRPGLTLRSGPKGRVSRGGETHRGCCPSFETAGLPRGLLRLRLESSATALRQRP
jgi:hypothetical protein